MEVKSPTPTEASHSSNQGPLGYTWTPRYGAVIIGAVDRGHSPPDHISRKSGVESRYTLPFSPEERKPQIGIQGVGCYPQAWCRFAVGLTWAYRTRKEGIIGGTGKTTAAKRDREKARQQKQRDKEERRAQRKATKLNRSEQGDEDPDLAGLHWGPQPPLY